MKNKSLRVYRSSQVLLLVIFKSQKLVENMLQAQVETVQHVSKTVHKAMIVYNSKDEKAQSPKKEPKVEATSVEDILIRSPIHDSPV